MNKFIIANHKKCIGCKACEIACAVANLPGSVVDASKTAKKFIPRLNLVKVDSSITPVQCRQCVDAACIKACPVNAIIHHGDNYIVDQSKCIGCKRCMKACPYGVIEVAELYEEKRQVHNSKLPRTAYKCDMCINREAGPACIEVCPVDAFIILDRRNFKTFVGRVK